MGRILTVAQMRGIEAAAMDWGGVTGLALMERAGEGVVAAIRDRWPDLAAGRARVVVICGPGNNGGDGYVVARLLAGWGWQVRVLALGDVARLPPDARANHDRWLAMGGTVAPLQDAVAEPSDLLVDALFGIGMSRPFASDALDALLAGSDRVVAVDVPSGLLADSGHVVAPAIRADLTVAFHRAKLGQYLGDGPSLCRELVVADIGLRGGDEGVALVGPPPVALLAKAGAAHKFGHGHALVLAGGPGRGGAARLAARAALRVGAGLVTLGAEPAALAENAARLDAVMLRQVAGAGDLAEALLDGRITALCLGPGLGLARAEGLLEGALSARRGLVLDADALTVLAGRGWPLPMQAVLTPHGGEFARLFPDLAQDLAGGRSDKIAVTQAAARRAGAVVLFKGADSVIAAPDGRVALHAAAYGRAAPWLATAGAGDVLAGIIAGLLARGRDPFDAACAAAWLHVEAARQVGAGLIAEDLPDALPAVLRDLGA